jgi:hypothetical protein
MLTIGPKVIGYPSNINRGMLENNIDPAAERYIVMDRLNLSVIWHGVKPASGNAKIIVPLEYTIGHNLMALILDDTGTPMHYVTGNDKIQAQLVDARMVTLNP